MELRHDTCESYSPQNYSMDIIKEVSLTELNDCEVAVTESLLATGPVLAWKQKGDWMTLPVFVAEWKLTNMNAATLSQLCKVLKVPGASSLNHRNRCELFLRFLGYSEEHILCQMALIPEKEPRARKARQTEDSCE